MDNGAAVNGHALTAISGGTTIEPHGYAVIAKTPDDFLSAAYPLLKSSLGIKTSSDTVTLKNGTAVIDSVSIDGSATGGVSFQKTATGWIAAQSTPGAINATAPSVDTPPPPASSSSTPSTANSTASNSTTAQANIIATVSTHYSYLPLSDFAAAQSLAVSAGRPRLASVGNPVEFQAEATSSDAVVVYNWTFGDGTTASGKLVRHIFEYPGEYVVVLNASSGIVKAVARTNVKILAPAISIAEANEKFIRIKNTSSNEINLFGWELSSSGTAFVFPQDTIILAGQAISFAKDVTGISPKNKNEIVLVAQGLAQATTTSAQSPSTEGTRQEILEKLAVLRKASEMLAYKERLQSTKSVAKKTNTLPRIAAASSTQLQVAAPIVALQMSSSTIATSSPPQQSKLLQTVRHFFGMQ